MTIPAGTDEKPPTSSTTKLIVFLSLIGAGGCAAVVLCVVLLGASIFYTASRQSALYETFQGQSLPEFGTSGTWINTDESLTLASLQGNVVWLEFSFMH